MLFLEVETDEGITGLGERITGNTYSDRLGDLKSQISLINEMASMYVIGENPFNIELIWDKMYGARHDFRHPSLQLTPVLSAIEIALWDIVGKAANQPIYNLLGGQYHEKLRAYAYMPEGGFRENPEKAGEIAQQLLDEGNTACKLDPFQPLFPLPRDIPLWEIEHAAKIFESIRDAVGNRLEVGIGHSRSAYYLQRDQSRGLPGAVPSVLVRGACSPLRTSRRWRASPAHTSIPIATGERLVTKYEFSNLLEKQAAQIIQLDVGQCGGIMEAKKIASIAEAHYAMIAPHMACGPIVAAAAIQVDTCSPNFLIQEANLGPLHHVIFKEPLVFENGFITPPTGPGLGIELNEDVIKRIEVE